MPTRAVFRCQFCDAVPDHGTQRSLAGQVTERMFGEYLDAFPGRWLVWNGGGPLGPRRYACREHRGDLVAYLRYHYATVAAQVWKMPPYPQRWPDEKRQHMGGSMGIIKFGLRGGLLQDRKAPEPDAGPPPPSTAATPPPLDGPAASRREPAAPAGDAGVPGSGEAPPSQLGGRPPDPDHPLDPAELVDPANLVDPADLLGPEDPFGPGDPPSPDDRFGQDDPFAPGELFPPGDMFPPGELFLPTDGPFAGETGPSTGEGSDDEGDGPWPHRPEDGPWPPGPPRPPGPHGPPGGPGDGP